MKSVIRILALVASLLPGLVSGEESIASKSQLPASYQSLFNDSSATKFVLSPDQNWLILAQKAGYQDYQTAVSSNYFKVVGKSLHTNLATEQNRPEYTELLLINLTTKQQLSISKDGATFVDMRWSPDSKKLALAIKQSNKITLWKYQLTDHQLQLWFDQPLSLQLSNSTIAWLPDSEQVVVRQSLLQSPQASQLNYQPVVKNSATVKASRVYRDLLDTLEKRDRFKSLLAQQAVLVGGGKSRVMSSPSMLESISVSPNGRYLLTTQLDENLDATVKFSRLARRYQVIDIETGTAAASPKKLTAATNKAKIKDSAPYGSRSVQWQGNAPASLTWVETLSDLGVDESLPVLDAIYSWSMPFTAKPELLTETNWRVFDYYWTELGRLISIEWKYADKQIKLNSYIDGQEKVLLEQYNYRNKFQNPGDIDTETTPLGSRRATSLADNQVYLFGQGYSEDGQKPFVTSYDINGKKTQLFTSSSEQLESPFYILKNSNFIVLSEKTTKPQVLHMVNQKQQRTALFDWQSSNLAYVEQPPLNLEFIRSDGLKMNTDVFFPSDTTGEKVPAVIWLYPAETTFERGQQRNSLAQRFIEIEPTSYFTSLLEGVAVVDMSSFPIVKPEDREANDSFIEQQIMNSQALIKALEATGRIDTSKLMLMGHSYGAFSALNLLAHTDLFSGAIVRSGAYNRTLTPLGFQHETRSLWQAPELYQKMSPLFQADKIKEPVLLIHGSSDQNPGTSQLQSKMMFEALQANNTTARLVLLPEDGHNYTIKENLQLMLSHQREWINTFLAH